MKRNWTFGIVKILLVIGIVIAGFGFAVLQLWNLLMPVIFGLPSLTFWQAMGLLALSWLLFGGWRGIPGRWHRHGGMRERWERMTPEERVNFRKAMEHRWGRHCPASASPVDDAKPHAPDAPEGT
ncbi:MAG TPA: hypothetical protein VJ011_05035 [Steroidobacteraceae bacterium]|nr:hypothetical protein [Steroidobacteraceae bacterium]